MSNNPKKPQIDENRQLFDPRNSSLSLPMEESSEFQNMFLDDGYFKSSSKKIIKKGSKIGTEFNSEDFNAEKYIQNKDKFIGRKGSTNWSKNVSDLRKKFGFSWSKFGQKFGIFSLVLAVFFLVGMTGITAIAVDMWNKTESIDRLDRTPNQNSIVYARDGKTKIYEYFDEEKREVINDIKDIPLVMQVAVVALEDKDFYNNEQGIPWKNLIGASGKCLLSGGDECRGASGISQQLIKNLTGDDEQNLDRKRKELFRAIKMNQEKTPDEILLKYLNWVPFGRNSYGVQEASKAYFNKPVNEKNEEGEYTLTPSEACYLASVINQPGYYQSGIAKLPEANKFKYEISQSLQKPSADETATDKLKTIPQNSIDLENRKDECLKNLRQLTLKVYDRTPEGKIIRDGDDRPVTTSGNFLKSDQELENYRNQEVIVTTKGEEASKARKENKVAFVNSTIEDPYPHFREYITQELDKIVGSNQLNQNGYKITTTLDTDIQKKIDEVLKKSEKTIKTYGGNNASAVVLDGPTGEIVAMVGSLGYDRADIDGKVNVATSPQQPGSSIKPYVYMNAFRNGFNPGTVLMDTEFNDAGYKPRNFDGKFRGPVTMRRALQGSLNIPAVKSMYLVNDEPKWNLESKLENFFDFTESLGLKYPCIEGAYNEKFPDKKEVCKPNPEKGITQKDVDTAYRNRCFLATALGGCEITLLSHVSAFNTIAQEGKIRTAKPFINITQKDSDRDIFKEKQNNPKLEERPYLDKDLEESQVLLAKQMNNVMSDYEARTPEFGSLRFNLQPTGYAGKYTAKTGTSNGPKDFWTIGATPHYTVALWVGNTDNKNMDPTASAGAVIATIWKEIMDELHKDKPAKNFSTEGLIRTSPTTITTTNDKGEKEQKTIGTSEILTPEQANQRYKLPTVSINNPQELQNFKEKDIFKNRSTLIPASFAVNKLDGKMFVSGKTLEQNKEQVECLLAMSEFPQVPSWQKPVDNLVNNSPNYCKIPEVSDQDQISTKDQTPNFETNFSNNSVINSTSLNAKVFFEKNVGKNIESTKLSINNAVVMQSQNGEISFPTQTLQNKTVKIDIEVTDNLKNTYTKTFENVKIGNISNIQKTNLLASDIKSLGCPLSAKINTTITCSLSFSPDKKYTVLGIKIGSGLTSSCNSFPAGASCNRINVPNLAKNKTEIFITIDGVTTEIGKIDIVL
jgi:membrane peptidoglycan carboxypeptidase